MKTLYTLFGIALCVGIGALVILSFRRPMSRKKFDLFYNEWFMVMELLNETPENTFIKDELYFSYRIAFDNFCKYDISEAYKALHENELFLQTKESIINVYVQENKKEENQV